MLQHFLFPIAISFHRRLDCTESVMGVAASKDHIAVIGKQSDEVLLFDNIDGKAEVQRLKIPGMKRPWDVIAYKTSIVVSDEERACLWKIDDWEDPLKYRTTQYSDISMSKKNIMETKTHRLGALARGLDDGTFMVRVTIREKSKFKFIKNIQDSTHKRHEFGSHVQNPYHVAPYVKGDSYAVIHQMGSTTESTRSVDLVRFDGKLHEHSSFIHTLCDAVHLNKPESVAVDEDGRIFIADCNNFRIVVIQDGRSISVVKLGENEHPHKLCFVPERRQLIVGLVSNVVLVFNLSPK